VIESKTEKKGRALPYGVIKVADNRTTRKGYQNTWVTTKKSGGIKIRREETTASPGDWTWAQSALEEGNTL